MGRKRGVTNNSLPPKQKPRLESPPSSPPPATNSVLSQLDACSPPSSSLPATSCTVSPSLGTCMAASSPPINVASPAANSRKQSTPGWSFLGLTPKSSKPSGEPEKPSGEPEKSEDDLMDETDTVGFDSAKSFVYRYFYRFPPLGPEPLLKYAICKRCRGEKGKNSLCSINISVSLSPTRLWDHLSKFHKMDYETAMAASMPAPHEGNKITNYLVDPDKDAHFAAYMKFATFFHLPIYFLEAPQFREFIAALNPSSELTRKCRQSARTWLSGSAYEARTALIHHLTDQAVSITTDHWSSISMHSYAGYTAHWIDENYILKSASLGCFQVHGATVDKMIAEIPIHLLKYGIVFDKITCLVTDTAPNMNALGNKMRDMNLQWHGCSAHVLQLSTDVFTESPIIATVISKIRRNVGHFKSSTQNLEVLEALQRGYFKEHGGEPDCPPEEYLKPIQENNTRWWSTFSMIERWLKLQPFLLTYMLPAHHPLEDWVLMEDIVNVLRGYRASQKILEGEKYITSSAMLLCLHKLQKELRKLICKTKEVQDLLPVVLDDLYNRYGDFRTPIYRMSTVLGDRKRIVGVPILNFHATFLDPRVKQMKFLHEADRKAILQDIIEIISEPSFQLRPTSVVQTEVVVIDDEAPKSTENDDGDEYYVADNVVVPPEDEVNRYYVMTSLARGSDPLQWWKLNYINFPRLAKYARTVLAIPATSAPCERLFSEMGDIISEKRNRLTPSNACDEVLVAENEELIQEYRKFKQSKKK